MSNYDNEEFDGREEYYQGERKNSASDIVGIFLWGFGVIVFMVVSLSMVFDRGKDKAIDPNSEEAVRAYINNIDHIQEVVINSMQHLGNTCNEAISTAISLAEDGEITNEENEYLLKVDKACDSGAGSKIESIDVYKTIKTRLEMKKAKKTRSLRLFNK